MCVGTLRPDLIESASSLVSTKAQVIKTHHNDTPLVRELRELVSIHLIHTRTHPHLCVVTRGEW